MSINNLETGAGVGSLFACLSKEKIKPPPMQMKKKNPATTTTMMTTTTKGITAAPPRRQPMKNNEAAQSKSKNKNAGIVTQRRKKPPATLKRQRTVDTGISTPTASKRKKPSRINPVAAVGLLEDDDRETD